MPALDGIRILDMTQYEAGPSCTQALAWLGADVVKIEPPETGEPGRSLAEGGTYSAYFCNWNANKRSLALDLNRDEGRALLRRMLPHYDIFIENYGPGITERFGLEYEALAELHPGLIYVTLKGFGSDGPYSDYKSYDMVAQAASGAFSVTGDPGGEPILPGPTLGDSGTGTQAGMAILAAYIQRLRTGQGQRIEISMQEAMTYYMRTRLSFLGNWGQQACPRIGSSMGGAPTGLYRCLGGGPNDYVYLITVTQRHWDALCLAMDRPDLVVDPRFDTGEKRMEHGEILRQEVELWTEKHEKYDAMHILCDAGVPSSAILDTQELYTDPHLVERGFIQKIEHPELGEAPVLGFAPRLSESPVEITRAPFLGEHTEEVLTHDLGMASEEIAQLREDGLIE